MPDKQVRLEPMTPTRYLAWVGQTISGSATQQVDSGAMHASQAREYAERQFDRLLPRGLSTPDQHIWSAFDGEAEVGYLWLGLSRRAGAVEGYVYDVAVLPSLRGHGYGRAIMRAGEDKAAALGAVAIRLNVFGHNTGARALYRSLGYGAVATLMHKDLDPGQDRG